VKVPPFELSTEEIREELGRLRNDLSIAIVRAKNPFNIGAMIRVAHSFLVREIFLIGVEPFYERAAMGMHKYETIVECSSEDDFLAHVKGRTLLGVERDHATTSLWEVPMPKDLVFIFGSEDDGIPPSLLAACSAVFAIPMYGINHSFPVAISSGMVLSEWARRRDPRARRTPPGEGPDLA
jgi:tRNA G18 (ribose-2'-O)-methylase SpoU